MKILLYNNFPFHHEMFGFALDFCKKYNHEADVCNPQDNEKYMELYTILGYTYKIVTDINQELYDLIIVLTDSDWSYLPKYINNKTICINHWYQNRNEYIKNAIPIAPFNSEYYNPEFILPVHPIITKTQKDSFKTTGEIIVTVMGRFIPDDISYFDFIVNHNVIYNIISKSPPSPLLSKHKNIKIHTNIDAITLCNIMANSHYILVTDINYNHNKCYSVSASLAYAFSTMCQLIIPKEMNSYLRLKSAVIYEKNKKITLTLPDIKSVNEEAEHFMLKRNEILQKYLNT